MNSLIKCVRLNEKVLSHDMSKVDSDKLLAKLRLTYTPPIRPGERAVAFAVSRELSRRGMAPRWQFDDLDDALSLLLTAGRREKEYRAELKEARDIKRDDKIIFDLLWVTIAYPKHITDNSNWRELFNCNDDWAQWLNVAESIDKRCANLAKKVKGLRLNEEQLFGCRYLCGSVHNTRLIRFEARQPAIADKIEQATGHIKSQKGQLDIASRARYWLAGKLTAWSPSKGARVYTMMTGKKVTKQATAQAFGKVKKIK